MVSPQLFIADSGYVDTVPCVAFTAELLLKVIGADSFCERPSGASCVFMRELATQFSTYGEYLVPNGASVVADVYEVVRLGVEYIHGVFAESVVVGHKLRRTVLRFPEFDRGGLLRYLRQVGGVYGVKVVDGVFSPVGRDGLGCVLE